MTRLQVVPIRRGEHGRQHPETQAKGLPPHPTLSEAVKVAAGDG